MRLIILGSLFLSLALLSCQETNELIPREIFFEGETLTSFAMDDDASRLYFKSTEHPNDILYSSIGNLEKVDTIKFEGSVKDFLPVNNQLLTIWKDSIYRLSFGEELLQTPPSLFYIKLLSRITSNNKFPLQLHSKVAGQSGIYSLDLGTKEFSKIHELQPMSAVFLDEDFNLIAGNDKNQSGGNNMYFRKGNEWVLLESHDWEVDAMLGGFSKIISVSSDGKEIYFTSNKNTDKSRLYSYHTKTETVTELASHPKVDLVPFGASFDQQGKVTSVVGLFGETIRVSLGESKSDFEYLSKKIEGDISFISALADDTKWLIREFTGGPSKIYLFDREAKKLTYLLSDYPLMDNHTLATRKSFSVISHDGLELPIHVYLPPGTDKNNDGIPDKLLPTIMYVHGGPWVGVVHWNQNYHTRNFQLLANRGYAVINCEFRGGTGLGKEFVGKSVKTWGTDMVKDKVEIAKWAVNFKIAQEDKIGLWGWSYGGYATLAGLTFSPETYACGISMYGISDLASFGKTPYVNNDFWKGMVGDPDDSAEVQMLRDYSPINFAGNIKAPMLLTTGSLDKRVPQIQVDQMADKLEELNKEVVYFYYPKEGHDYEKKETWLTFWAVAEGFLKENLGGQSIPLTEDLEPLIIKKGEAFINGLRPKTE